MMNADIEDFITVKNNGGRDDYNNFNPEDWDIDAAKNLFIELLEWIETRSDMLNMGNNNKLVKLFERVLSQGMRRHKVIGSMRKSILLNIINKVLINSDDFPEHLQKHLPLLRLLLRKKPGRNLSGITCITVITAPFPDGQKFSCKHNCYYCPNEPAHEGNGWQAQPRSYLFHEPAVLRANRHKFTAIGQMLNRLDTYYSNGHVPDKVEIIVEGGTFTEYPVDYLNRYHRDLFYAANIYFDLRSAFPDYDCAGDDGLDYANLEKVRVPGTIEEEIMINQTARVHIIGICVETRPDALDDPEWLQRFRKWGVTRVQLGAQHVDNRILKKVNRGHTIEKLIWAMQYLQDNCFKIDIHIMPDLPGASPEIDKAMFDYVYSVICPDQMKVYPCQTIPWTIIEKWYKAGTYVPYFDQDPKLLIDVVRYSMETCPNWLRMPRVIRDIPCSVYVEGGNTIGNMRQVIDKLIDGEGDGVYSREIRSREIGRHSEYYEKPAQYTTSYYYACGGHNYFIEYESFDGRAIFGFIRLRFTEAIGNMTQFDILRGRGLVREIHVYGDTTAVDMHVKTCGCQHTGIGSGLLRRAEQVTMENGFSGIVVISGEGVKGYYLKRGYQEVDTFMVKDFDWWMVRYYCMKKKISVLVLDLWKRGFNWIMMFGGVFIVIMLFRVLIN